MRNLQNLTDDELREKRRAAREEFQTLTQELHQRNPQPSVSTPRFGGSFAPPLTPAKVSEYFALAESAPDAVREAMVELCELYTLFHKTPASTEPGKPHPSGRGFITPLSSEEIKRIWDYVPWNDEVPGHHVNEVALLAKLFDGISPKTHKALRDAAFHLLWYATELANDREPLTTDKL